MPTAEVVPLAQGGQETGESPAGTLPFTTFEAERQAIMKTLPCKWMSLSGGDGAARYDFLCKGGTWATVSLMMDKRGADGISRVRLLFRDVAESAYSPAGEAYVAQQFLQHVTAHFVPANLAREVNEAFWGRRDRGWRGAGVNVRLSMTREAIQTVRKLEIIGKGKPLVPQVTAPVQASESQSVAPDVRDDIEQRIRLHDATVSMPEQKGELLPQPPLPILNDALKALEASPTLQPATPEELHTTPEPSSRQKPVAPPALAPQLVPDAKATINNRPRAPSNFENYNKAEELTKDVEAKALEDSRKDAKIKPADAIAPLAKPGQSVQAIQTPTVGGETAEELLAPKTTQQWPQGEGLGNPTSTPVQGVAPHQPAQNIVPPDVPYGKLPARNLPQLDFIPKAKPLERPDEIIQFEDEGSGL